MSALSRDYYSMELHKVSGLVPETIALLAVWRPGMSGRELAELAVRENVLGKASASRVKDVVLEGFAKRYLRPDESPAATLKALVSAAAGLPRLKQLFLVHTCRNQAVLRDFLTVVYWPLARAGHERVEKAEAMRFLRDAFHSERIAGRWSEPTVDRVAQGIFKCLEDFGLLRKVRAGSREILDFRAEPFTVLHLAYEAHFRGAGDTAILALPDWRWLGMTSAGVVDAFRRVAAATNALIFQYAGDLARFTFPCADMEELAHAYPG